MLNRIHIKGCQSLDDVEVRSSPLAVRFGPNAAGKSDFLDALQRVSRGGYRFDADGSKAPARSSRPVEASSLAGSPATRTWRRVRGRLKS